MKAKRLLAIFAAFTMSAAMFAVGCGNDDNKDDNKKPDTEQGGGDNTDPENPGGENPGGENPGGENPGGENPGGENPGGENPGGENPGGENPGGENPGGENPGGETPTEFTGKIYLVGDSTVCAFSDNYYIPRYGYGTQLYNYFNCAEDQIVNLALSGRSSKSFLTEANYTTLKNSISEGDYLIIGFGHNDEKSEEEARYTDANGTHTEATTANGDSFQYVLYENYIKVAEAVGATPILCTPIVRYDAAGNYSGAKIHNTTASDKLGMGGDYSQAIRDLGKATDTTVIDLTAITKSVYEADNDAAQYFHAHTTYDGTLPDVTPAGRDDTHISMYGAKMVAYQFANALKETDNALKNYVKDGIAAPTYEADYASSIKADFVKPDYTPFDPSANEANELGGGWYHTVMGDVGGASKVADYTITKGADGNFTVGIEAAQGKFASGADGFAAAFMQIEANKNFKAKATATVIASANANNQSGFGLMLRDDILIDTHDNTVNSNYVAAGLLKDKATIFSRIGGGSIANHNSAPASIANGDTFELEIERIGQTIIAKVNGTVYTETDLDFVARDNGYMYICLFANRGFMIEYSNVDVTITGESQGA